MVFLQDLADLDIECIQQFAPGVVTDMRDTFRRADNICKEHGCEQSLPLAHVLRAGQELLNLVENRIAITQPRRMNLAWKFDKLRTRNVACKVTGMFDIDDRIARPV